MNRTYVEDLKDPVEVLPPGRNRIFIALGVQDPRDNMTFIPIDDLLLDLGYSPATSETW